MLKFFSLTPLIKLRSLTNGNLKKRKMPLTKRTFRSYLKNKRLPKIFLFQQLEITVKETAKKKVERA